MVVTTVHTVITAMTAHAQSGREYSAWSMTATRGAAYPRLANRKTAIARHSGSELPALGRLRRGLRRGGHCHSHKATLAGFGAHVCTEFGFGFGFGRVAREALFSEMAASASCRFRI